MGSTSRVNAALSSRRVRPVIASIVSASTDARRRRRRLVGGGGVGAHGEEATARDAQRHARGGAEHRPREEPEHLLCVPSPSSDSTIIASPPVADARKVTVRGSSHGP